MWKTIDCTLRDRGDRPYVFTVETKGVNRLKEQALRFLMRKLIYAFTGIFVVIVTFIVTH